MNRLKVCYNLLLRVFRDGAYASIALDKELQSITKQARPFVTRLFYGVLDTSITYDYYIGCLCPKKPKNAEIVLLKMGFYLLEHSDMPAYAVLHEIAELAKGVGKSGAVGFINAVLRKKQAVTLPAAGTDLYLSVKYSYPEWLVSRLTNDYGFEQTEEILATKPTQEIHIRVNENRLSPGEFEQIYPFLLGKSDRIGYYVTHNELDNMNVAHYSVQSMASSLAVRCYIDGIQDDITSVLDTCAAPGGKAVYLKQLCPQAEVTACDIHAHRCELIRKYSRQAGVPLQIQNVDATQLHSEFINAFDLVICDVPCSGIGVISSKPDILLHRKAEDIDALCALQVRILEVCSRYVKEGGYICYSTCTILKQENDAVVSQFLQAHPDFVLSPIQSAYCAADADGVVRMFPHTTQTDGFFVARMRKEGA